MAIKLPSWQTVTVVAGAALLAAACGSSGTTSSTSSPATTSAAPSSAAPPSANAALCADADALRASLDKLTHINVGKGAAADIKTNLADVQSKLNTLTADARGQWHSQTTALHTALADLKTATSALSANPSVSTVAGVVTAMGGVTSAASNLLAAMNTDCPSASASPSA